MNTARVGRARLWTAGCLLLAMIVARAADPVVSRLRAVQRPGTQLVDITYEVADPDSATVTVSISVSDTGGATYAVPAPSFTGDIGSGVTPGANKKITWDAGKDWPGRFSANMRFKVTAEDAAPVPAGMVLIPAGSFQMGDSFGEGASTERPVHTLTVSAFYMDRTEVTKALWDEVYAWAIGHGYSFDNPGCWYAGFSFSKGPSHPVHFINWYDIVKWCNARSEKEGRVPAYYMSSAKTTVYRTGQLDVQNDWVNWNAGYRLPTEAEWEYAARGGLSGKRFPWGDTISHSQANYYSSSSYSYDVSPTRGCHPTYAVGNYPCTSPVGSFAPNAYGLYDMAGNVLEWCWDWWCPDWYSSGYYGSSPSSDPRGPASDSFRVRVVRGGGWDPYAEYCRVSYRSWNGPDGWYNYGFGFRSVLPPGQ